jgi:hypothetical protein
MSSLLKFSKANAKLSKRLIFNLPAGFTCPFARSCRTIADPKTGKILDLQRGDDQKIFRCFAASSESRSPSARALRWHNYNLLREESMYSMRDLIVESIKASSTKKISNPNKLCRIHESGDFFSHNYMHAWFLAANKFPEMKFYAYTKSLDYWFDMYSHIPSNVYLTASRGGALDYMIDKFPEVFYRTSQVVYNQQEADDLSLEVDHDDSHCFGDKPFALLVHGVQPAGSDASKHLARRRKDGAWAGYNNKDSILVAK